MGSRGDPAGAWAAATHARVREAAKTRNGALRPNSIGKSAGTPGPRPRDMIAADGHSLPLSYAAHGRSASQA